MAIISFLLHVAGGLCLFLFGMRIMSNGLQQSAGDRLRRTLNWVTGNRFSGMLTGFVVSSVIQSPSAAVVLVMVFAHAGLLTMTQSIGIILGANAGAIVTVWIVSLSGFSIDISGLALPAVGIGFILSHIKWKYRSLGDLILGFGFLFWGLDLLTQTLAVTAGYYNLNLLAAVSQFGFGSLLIGAFTGMVMTALLHSPGASTVIVLSLVNYGVIPYEMAASMVLGANIGATIDAAIAAFWTGSLAKRAALAHVLFNAIGVLWALPLLKPLLALVHFIMPGSPFSGDPVTAAHMAMLHTVFYIINTLVFLPLVKPYAYFISRLVREDRSKEESGHYHFTYFSGGVDDTPEHNLARAEKEVRDMAGIVSTMYARFSTVLGNLRKIKDREKTVADLCEELKVKEVYIDEMRDSISGFLIECTRDNPNTRSELRITHLLRLIGNIEDMSDECYYISRLLEKSVRRNYVFKDDEIDILVPFVDLVEKYLTLLQEQLGYASRVELAVHTVELENDIDISNKKLQKMSRRRINADEDIKMELHFIELVRRVEKLGDFCTDITGIITNN